MATVVHLFHTPEREAHYAPQVGKVLLWLGNDGAGLPEPPYVLTGFAVVNTPDGQPHRILLTVESDAALMEARRLMRRIKHNLGEDSAWPPPVVAPRRGWVRLWRWLIGGGRR
jgi:hypothetical protein